MRRKKERKKDKKSQAKEEPKQYTYFEKTNDAEKSSVCVCERHTLRGWCHASFRDGDVGQHAPSMQSSAVSRNLNLPARRKHDPSRVA